MSTQKFQDPKIGSKEIQNCINKMIGGYDIPLDFIDLIIDEGAFKKMEITKGPGISESHNILLNAILDKFNHEAKLVDSALKGKITTK